MAAKQYDAIVIGARCAGSPTAMLLARKGRDVLVVDRATFPSDTISTHLIHPPGVAALKKWGLLDRLVGDRMPAHRHVCVRLRADPDHRRPGPRLARRVCPAPHRARQAPRGRRVRSGRGGSGGIHGRGGPPRRRPRRRHPGSQQGRPAGHRTCKGGHRSGRHSLARRGGREAPAVQREAAPERQLLHLLERACR